jgi:hypothetical protein
MINKVIDGISIKLNQVFGDNFKIYSEDVSQGFAEPCFFILTLNPKQTNLIGNRSLRQQLFDIHYFPAVQNNTELQEKASDLFDAMEYITLVDGDLVHGTKMNYEIIDGVLHFYVSFNMIINKVTDPEDSMEILTLKG